MTWPILGNFWVDSGPKGCRARRARSPLAEGREGKVPEEQGLSIPNEQSAHIT